MTDPNTHPPAWHRLASNLPRNVIALAAVSFLTDVSSEMIYPLIPVFLGTVVGASATMVGAIEGAAESTSALLKIASGWWSDRAKRRKPLVVAGYAIASFVRPLLGLAQSAGQVLAIRVIDRVGKGIRGAPRDALIADSVDPSQRGRAFGFHRAADHAGGVVGPLLAFTLLGWGGLTMRTVFLLAAIPAALCMVVLVFGVREPRHVNAATPTPVTPAVTRVESELDSDGAAVSAAGTQVSLAPTKGLGRRFWAYLAVLLLFTLGNSSDAFLLLRASQLGVSTAMIPILWATLHVVKSLASTPGGALSDRVGRAPLIIAGWALYAAVYLGFAQATTTWHVWALFACYGIFFGLTESVERALVADLVPAALRGTAYGWFNLAIGLGALPASILFGTIWDRAGSPAAFGFGAAMAVMAAVCVGFVVPNARRETGG